MISVIGSPSVSWEEKDASTFTIGQSSTIGGIVGNFSQGPVGEMFLVSSPAALLNHFGEPNDINYKDWYCAYNFLMYSNALKVIRIVGSTAKNACDVVPNATATPPVEDECILIKSNSHFESLRGTLSTDTKKAKVFAKYAGAYINGYKVLIHDKARIEDTSTVSPLQNYVNKVMSDDEVAFGVFKNTGELLEFGIYSLNKNSLDMNGYGNYLISAVNNTSQYVYLIENKIITYNASGVRQPLNLTLTLQGGVDSDPTDADYKKGWDVFRQNEIEDVDLLIQGGASSDVGQYIISTIAENRKDCIAFVSPDESDVVEQADPVTRIKSKVNSNSPIYPMSSYRVFDGNYKYQYDQYNECYRWIPLNGDIAGCVAQTDFESDPWYSPGGKAIKNVTKLAFYPTKAQRDELWGATINPVTSFNQEGTVLWGDQTGATQSKMNFIGVRRCFIYMEKNIAEMARKIMWKQNNTETEETFKQAVEPFLRNIQGGNGISDFAVYTGAEAAEDYLDLADQGIFPAKILIKPISSVRWIQLQFVASRSDVTFSEIVV